MSREEVNQKAELSWRLEDYRRWGVEAPKRVEDNPGVCEGQMMSDDEIAEYIHDGVQVLLVLSDRKSERIDDVRESFYADLKFLLSIDRLTVEEYTEITKSDNYKT
jgi:hypothetical protein